MPLMSTERTKSTCVTLLSSFVRNEWSLGPTKVSDGVEYTSMNRELSRQDALVSSDL